MIVLSCQREGDLGKDSGRLYMHSKECCEALVEPAVKEIVMCINRR